MRPFIASLIAVVVIVSSARADVSVKSPDGSVEIKLLTDQPRLRFAVSMKGQTVIEPSPIVFTVDNVDLADGVTLSRLEKYAVNEEYPIAPVHARAVNYCDGVRQSIKHNATGQEFTIDLRAYRDGAAFRLVVAGGTDKARTPEETTKFTLPTGTTVWSHDLVGHYEGVYAKKDIAALEGGTWHAPPVTLKLPSGAYAMLTEANLVNYSGMALEADCQRGFRVGLGHRQPVNHPYELRYSKDDVARLHIPATITGTITTPWRVVMLASDLNDLVNSDLITNLNPGFDKKLFPEASNTRWVFPGRAVWRYLDNDPDPAQDSRGTTRPTTRPASAPASPLQRAGSDAVALVDASLAQASKPAEAGEPAKAEEVPTTRATTTTSGPTSTSRPRVNAKDMRLWSELAGKLGFEYSILEGFWARWNDDELKDLVSYSRAQGVGIFVWVNSKSLHDPAARTALYKRCTDAGVAGLKVDFFDHEHKETIDLYATLLKECAENKLMLDFHGANKPTGLNRTWPNEMVREAVKGMEARKMESRALHETTVPFTRLPVGAAEYTGTLFTERRGDTTFAHQIAVAVIYAAPLQTYAAHPVKLLSSPAVDVIRQIPPVWDQTIVLPPSEIGEVAVYARRLGDKWFLGVLNGTSPRELKIPLTFLGEKDKCIATFVRDGARPDEMKIEKELPMNHAQTITVDLPAGGGFVGVFAKKDE